MEAVIPAKSLPQFSKMLTCLSKVGDDLYFVALPNKVVLRALNQPRSAYFCFTLPLSFFESYAVAEGVEIKCKLLLKSCLAVFRSLEKVDSCSLSIELPIETVAFELHCKMGVKKCYRLNIEECEPLQAMYNKENCPNRMAIRGAPLNLALVNFSNQLEELSILFEPDIVLFRSHLDSTHTQGELSKRPLYTELSLSTHDLDHYDFGGHLTLTVSLKALRAISSFAERQPQPLLVYAQDEGRPLLFSMFVQGSFDADFVLATIAQQEETNEYSGSSAPASSSAHYSHGSAPASQAHHTPNSVLGKRARIETGSPHPLKKVKREESSGDHMDIKQQSHHSQSNSLSMNNKSVLLSNNSEPTSEPVLWAPKNPVLMELEEGDVPESDDE